MRIFSSLIGSLILLVAVCFAVSNRQMADVSLWPFDLQIEAPVYLLTLGSLLVGLFIGTVMTWIGLLPHRFAAKRMHKELARMNDKISALQQTVHSKEAAFASAAKPRSSWRFWKKST